jgi:hypothetical protein
MNAPNKTYLPRYNESKEYESNLSEFRVSAGFTIKELCRKAEILIGEYIVLNSGLKSPINREGKPCSQALKLAIFFDCELSDL